MSNTGMLFHVLTYNQQLTNIILMLLKILSLYQFMLSYFDSLMLRNL